METFTETKIINLNSRNSIKGNSTFLSDVYFSINGLLKDEEDILERYISIQNAQIPFSFYNINVYNNMLKIQIGATIYTLTLIRGNYNATSLITEIQNQLTNNGITDITLGVSSTTGLLTITKTTGSFSLISSGSTIYEALGFVVGTNYTSVSQKIISPYPLNLLGTLRLRICSYELSTSNIDFSLITLPIEVGNFGLIQYTNMTNIRVTLNNTSLDGFDISIIDDDNNYINFNNINWTMTFVLDIVRKRPNKTLTRFNEIIQQSQEPEIENNEEPQENQEEQNNIQEEPNQETVQDDLDLLLYNTFGNIN
jgi:hypothetical protein